MTIEPLIRLDAVTVTYPGASAPTLADVSLEIDEGELVLVVGSTGSGKSTLLGAMVGVHTVIGVGEGVITALVVGSVLALRPDLVWGAPDAGSRVPLEVRSGSVA